MSNESGNVIPEVLSKFIEKLFLPSTEEIGLILSDKLKFYRFKNQINIMNKTKNLCNENNIKPIESIGFAFKFWDNATLADNEEVQKRWASLLANATNKRSTRKEEHYDLCLNILKEMTVLEVSALDSIVKELQGYHEISRTWGNRFGCENRDDIGMMSLVKLGLIESDPLRDLNELNNLNNKATEIDKQRQRAYSFDNRLYATKDKRYFLTNLGEFFISTVYTTTELHDMEPPLM